MKLTAWYPAFVATAVCVACPLGFGATHSESGDELRLETGRWELVLDRRDGSLKRLRDKGAGEGVLLRGCGSLWSIERLNEEPVRAGQFSRQEDGTACVFASRWTAEENRLRLEWDGPDAKVIIDCAAADAGPVWRPMIRMKRGTLLGWRFPEGVEFDADELDVFYFPDNLGLGFLRGFFQPGGGGLVTERIAGEGMEYLVGERCGMRPVEDERIGIEPGRDAKGWLPGWYVDEMKEWRVKVNRPPGGDESDLELVASEHGPWLTGYRLGGEGWLFRFGGMLDESDFRKRFASVAATLYRLVGGNRSQEGQKKRIAVFAPNPMGRPGVKAGGDEGRWARELSDLPPLRNAGIRAVVMHGVEELMTALQRPEECFAVLNLGGERFPSAGENAWRKTLDGVRDYVRDGGVWWEAGGGYSFYQAVVPGRDASFESAGRHFCDFAALESEAGSWACFGVQAPDDLYVSPTMSVSASGPDDSRVGCFSHRSMWHVAEGREWFPPVQHMQVGVPMREALEAYGRVNGQMRGLGEKVPQEKLGELRESVLLKFTSGRLEEMAARVSELPAPMLVHISNYLRGGFDRQYPDHLPPNEDAGTGEDLRRLIDACREHGHLFSPYTNPSWWCTEPKGPTFERVGEAPLSRDLGGDLIREQYGSVPHRGFTVCAWHPAVRAANDIIRRQFTEEYPVDVLFQDQVGARSNRFDTNPAAPNPAAYLEGIHRIAQEDSKHVALGTEDGHDRLIDDEAMFCGLSWPWLPNRMVGNRVLYGHRWPEENWRIEPLALWLAHDKVLFYHHDLGGFVRDRCDLVTSLAFGYGMSYGVRGDRPLSARDRDWLDLLHRVQTGVCARYAGRALDEFGYVRRRIIRSRFGDLELLVNLEGEPYEGGDGVIVGVEGFFARAPGFEAGFLKKLGDREFDGEGMWIVRERVDGDWSEWLRSPFASAP